MIVASLVMAAIIALGLYAFFGLSRQERERAAAAREDAAPPSADAVSVDAADTVS